MQTASQRDRLHGKNERTIRIGALPVSFCENSAFEVITSNNASGEALARVGADIGEPLQVTVSGDRDRYGDCLR